MKHYSCFDKQGEMCSPSRGQTSLSAVLLFYQQRHLCLTLTQDPRRIKVWPRAIAPITNFYPRILLRSALAGYELLHTQYFEYNLNLKIK